MSRKHQPSLPQFLTRFVGRKEEIKRLETLFKTARLVTVTGLPGVGKTRLSVEVARRIGGRLRDGARFVSMEGLHNISTVIHATADALSLHDSSKLDTKTQLSFALSQSEMLLALDAAEGVVSEEFAVWIRDLLSECPSLWLLVTSQHPLGVQGEQIFQLAPLPLPRIGRQDADSMRLFEVRAGERIYGWKINAKNAPIIAQVCRLLDGIPLALELAAGQLKLGGEHALLEELKKGIDNLVATDRDRPPRHRSMTAALDYAFARLSEPERQILEGMSVLDSGSFFDTAI